jgi:hypothetical protein
MLIFNEKPYKIMQIFRQYRVLTRAPWSGAVGGGLAAATRSGLPGRGAAGRWQGVEERVRL